MEAKIDHMRLMPGIYVNKTDVVGNEAVTTFDIRLKRPNFEDAMSPEVSHTIERCGLSFLHSHPFWSDKVIHFGPIGCLTGFNLILKGNYVNTMKPVIDLVFSMMKFIVDYKGNVESLGFDAESCGNYTLNDLEGAKIVCANFLVLDEALNALLFEYPTAENNPGIMTSTQVFGDDKVNRDLKRARTLKKDVNVDYEAEKAESKTYQELSTRSKQELTPNTVIPEIVEEKMTLKKLLKECLEEENEIKTFINVVEKIKDASTLIDKSISSSQEQEDEDLIPKPTVNKKSSSKKTS
jgi:S-ribosylhomocysteine lyase